jgi:hypothetical protein
MGGCLGWSGYYGDTQGREGDVGGLVSQLAWGETGFSFLTGVSTG